MKRKMWWACSEKVDYGKEKGLKPADLLDNLRHFGMELGHGHNFELIRLVFWL
jgi:hypothetical protein